MFIQKMKVFQYKLTKRTDRMDKGSNGIVMEVSSLEHIKITKELKETSMS